MSNFIGICDTGLLPITCIQSKSLHHKMYCTDYNKQNLAFLSILSNFVPLSDTQCQSIMQSVIAPNESLSERTPVKTESMWQEHIDTF